MNHRKHGLVGSALKLCRAQHHLDSLKMLVQEFIDSKPYAFWVDPHPQSPDYVIRAHINRAVPATLGLAIGDTAHNARCALDYLVYQLSALSDSDPSSSGRSQGSAVSETASE
jgi:hypothetical protein